VNNEIEHSIAGESPGRPTRLRAVGAMIAVALVLAALAAGYLLLSGNDRQEAAPQPRPALTVEIATPARVTWPTMSSASGAIAPWQEASIGTQIGSYQLTEVRVNVGDQVRRGQILARLNPALLKAEEAQLLARYEQAAANDRRARGLQGVGGISDQDALQFATEAKTAAALLAAKRLELRYTFIVAPDDGVISARIATLGAVMPAGQELFRMIRRNRLEWRGEVTASQLQAVAAGERIALKLPDGTTASAVVRQAAPVLDAASRLAIIYADLVPGSRARAGMYVAGEIGTGESPALVVPAECVVVRDGRSHVIEVTGPGETPKVALRTVTPGRRNGNAIEILRGLTGKERLVRRGGAFLNDGDVVRVVGAREARP
jgi:RND family efflux transporter MFP subunit